MRGLIILALGLVVATARTSASRIVGGSVTSIEKYPFAAALLTNPMGVGTFVQTGGGTIINHRSILTAAQHTFWFQYPHQWRIRVGSTNWNSGGVLVTVNQVIPHGSFNSVTYENDIAILRINGAFDYNTNVRPAPIAEFNPPENAPVWVIGWGTLNETGTSVPSVQLRHVQMYVVNQAICRLRYTEVFRPVTNNMLCVGVLDVGGRGGCAGDAGGPVLHNNVVVGITSWGSGCGRPSYPDVSVRLSHYSTWIHINS